MFAHWSPIRSDAADDVQQRRDDPQVACDRRLACEQRQDALVYLHVAPVDPLILGDDDLGELDVVVADRLERAVQLLEHHPEALDRVALELPERFAELVAGLLHRGQRVPVLCRAYGIADTGRT